MTKTIAAMERALSAAVPATAAKTLVTVGCHQLSELDYDGPPLDEKTAKELRERFAPQDPTKTVWF